MLRVTHHPVLEELSVGSPVNVFLDGELIEAFEGEPIATALLAAGKVVFRFTHKLNEPRGVFCAIGRCTDCMMIVEGVPNVRTCVTAVKEGMKIKTQHGRGTREAVDRDN